MLPRELRHEHDVHGEQQSPQKRHALAETYGQRRTSPCYRHQPDTHHGEHGGPHVEHRRTFASDDPPEERHENAVGGRQERIDAWRGVIEPDRLRPEGRKVEHAQKRASRKGFPREQPAHAAPEDRQQNEPGHDETDAQQPGRRQHAHDVLHDDEAETPDDGGNDKQRFVHAGRYVLQGSHSGLLYDTHAFACRRFPSRHVLHGCRPGAEAAPPAQDLRPRPPRWRRTPKPGTTPPTQDDLAAGAPPFPTHTAAYRAPPPPPKPPPPPPEKPPPKPPPLLKLPLAPESAACAVDTVFATDVCIRSDTEGMTPPDAP